MAKQMIKQIVQLLLAFFLVSDTCAFTLRTKQVATPQRLATNHVLKTSTIATRVSINKQSFSRKSLEMSSSSDESGTPKSKLPMLLDPGTKGGALFLSLVLFVLPLIVYEVGTIGYGWDGTEAGKWLGVGFTFFTTVLWVATYIFRVATKDMTYAKQLKDYENAVIAKRLEELDEDEIQALVEDIERDDF